MDLTQDVMIDYTNYRGERAMRRVTPIAIRFESSEWHGSEQWLLRAVDVEKAAERDFAMKDIHSWRQIQPIY
jgi:predicted DNA-binding transcriptional regulator YafY